MDQKSYAKLSHIDAILQDTNVIDKTKLLTNLLDYSEADINFQIPSSSCLKDNKPHLLGNTALHFLLGARQLESFNNWINQGADVTIKNELGQTVLHQALNDSYHTGKKYWQLKGKLQHPFIDSILSAQISSGNATNPSDNDGISHFHGAVMTNNVRAVEFFTTNSQGTLVAQAISDNSKIFAGYTPLHFAARYSAFDVAKLLLDLGADVNCKDARGMTPLYLLIERNMKLMDWMLMGKRGPCEHVISELEVNEKLIVLLSAKSACFLLWNGTLSDLHVACTLRDLSLVRIVLGNSPNLERAVCSNSHVWPGYTALHFAAHFSIETVKLLIRNGANVLAANARGITPLDLCLQRYKPQDVHFMLERQLSCKNILMSDGKTTLANLMSAMSDNRTFESFVKSIEADINVSIPADSPLWPGCTPLHLAVFAAKQTKRITDLCLDVVNESIEIGRYNCTEGEDNLKLERIKLCLKFNADMTIQDARGFSPIHLAFYLHKPDVTYLLLQSHEKAFDSRDNDGLSLLHIACALNDVQSVEKLLKSGANINSLVKTEIFYTVLDDPGNASSAHHTRLIPALSTCLHIAIRDDNSIIAKIASDYKANIYAIDANGYTPLHYMIGSKHPKQWTSFMDIYEAHLQNSTASSGLSHLHIACFVESYRAAETLFTQNVDVEATIDPSSKESMLAPYLGFRPINFSMQNNDCFLIDRLIDKGTDLFKKSANGACPLHTAQENWKDEFSASNPKHHLVIDLWTSNKKLRRLLKKKTGLTDLHIACGQRDFLLVEKLVYRENPDINRVTLPDSPIWPNCTPLHVLLDVAMLEFNSREVFKILICAGANVTLTNGEGMTPLHQLFYRSFHQGCDIETSMAFNRVQESVINTTGPNRESLLHIAVSLERSSRTIQELLQIFEVNQQIDYFAEWFGSNAGFSSLHYCAAQNISHLDSLLKAGADIQSVDRYGNTAFHVAARRYGEEAIEKFVRARADINFKNIYNQTPLDLVVFSGGLKSELSTLCFKYNYDVQNFLTLDAAGYCMSFVHAAFKTSRRYLFHHRSYWIANHQLWKVGYDLDRQDHHGKTALHYATATGKIGVVEALLACGSDPNVLDADGETAFSHLVKCIKEVDSRVRAIADIFSNTLRAMQFSGIHTNSINIEAYKKVVSIIEKTVPPRFDVYAGEKTSNDILRADIEKLATVILGETSFCLKEILFDNTISAYPLMTEDTRHAIDQLFREKFKVLEDNFKMPTIGVLFLQYKKALERKNLIDRAKIAFYSLMGLKLPDLCVHMILKYLGNYELKYLIKISEFRT